MKLVRLVKSSDLKNVEHLIKNSGAGMTTMPKIGKEIKKRLVCTERSQKKNIKKNNHDTYLFVRKDKNKKEGKSENYNSVAKK